eukprot:scaffold6563_cov32-Tisochrysis_lutea.AAC.1
MVLKGSAFRKRKSSATSGTGANKVGLQPPVPAIAASARRAASPRLRSNTSTLLSAVSSPILPPIAGSLSLCWSCGVATREAAQRSRPNFSSLASSVSTSQAAGAARSAWDDCETKP